MFRRLGPFCALALALGSGAPSHAEATAADILPDYDVRQAAQRIAARPTGDRLVTTDPRTGAVAYLGRRNGLLSAPAPGTPKAIAARYMASHADTLGLDRGDVEALAPPAAVRSPDGITHLTYRQEVDGLDVYGTYLRVNVAASGAVVNVTGAPVGDLSVEDTAPGLGAAAARAAGRDAVGGAGIVSDLGLTVFPTQTKDRLAFRMTVDSPDALLYEVVVDAVTGRLLARHPLTSFLNQASVYDDYPDATRSPTLVTFGGGGKGGDPSWIDDTAGGTLLRGNNAYAYADTNGNNIADPSENVSQSGGNWTFPVTFFSQAECPSFKCTWDSTSAASKATNRNQTTTQLFYYVNRYHDYLKAAPFGFDEPSGNFEQADTAAPGLGGDRVLAEANDGSGTNNANFSQPPDGTPGRLQMFFWSINHDVNAGDDASIVYHELTHGMSTRLMAPGVLNVPGQGQAMHEGLADFYALDKLVGDGQIPDPAGPGDVFEAPYVIGGFGLFGTSGTPRPGIRNQAIDCSVAAPAAKCPASGSAGTGGFTFGDLGKVGSGHTYFDNGEIWAQTMWDLRGRIGLTAARGLITGALRNAPSGPSFLEMRDTILATAAATGQPQLPIWEVFAARGMGYGAVDPGEAATSAIDEFTVPPTLVARGVTVADPAPLGDGDGAAEPGETLLVTQGISNLGATPFTGLEGQLSSSSPGVFLGTAASRWADLAPGAVVANDPSFSVSIPTTHPCGQPVALSLALSAAGLPGGQTVPISVPTGAHVFVSSTDAGLPRAIPDANPTGIDSPLTAALPAGTVSGASVRITSLTHPYVGDLKLTLKHDTPATSVILTPGAGGGADNVANLIFEDRAALPVSAFSGAGPLTGLFRPASPLSAFDGQTTAGTWTLGVVDTGAGDTGSLIGWQLSPAPACATTAPPLPSAVTSAATDLTASGATLRGSVNAKGAATRFSFEYGPTAAYGKRTDAADAGSGADPAAVATALTGLAPDAVYHARLLALRGGAVLARGADVEFRTTKAAATVTPGPSSTPGPTATATATASATPSSTVVPVRQVKRTVSLSYKARKRRVSGNVRPKDACAARQTVRILRSRRGRDPVVATITTTASGTFSKRLKLKKGRYYATIAKRSVGGATCLAARSKVRALKR